MCFGRGELRSCNKSKLWGMSENLHRKLSNRDAVHAFGSYA